MLVMSDNLFGQTEPKHLLRSEGILFVHYSEALLHFVVPALLLLLSH